MKAQGNITSVPHQICLAAGNVLNDGTYSYTWNAEGQMVTANGVTYTYDGDGKRVKKSSGILYWGGFVETDASGNTTNEYIFFAGRRIARVNGSGSWFYYGDHLGSSRAITDSTGHLCYDTDFYPFGGERVVTNTCAQNYKFTGIERDTETGLDHTLNRQYSSNTGRWLSPDPLAGSVTNPQSLNRYAYVLNNPTNFVDRLGLACTMGYASQSTACYWGGGGPTGTNVLAVQASELAGMLGTNGGPHIGTCHIDGMEADCADVFRLVNAGAAALCPGPCKGINPYNNLPTEYRAFEGVGGYYSCSVAGEYGTQSAAANASKQCINAGSIATNTEFSENFFKTANGKYSFTPPMAGGADWSPFDPSAIPGGTSYAGFYHTHSSADPAYENEVFSTDDIDLARGGSNQGQPAYLFTPADRTEFFQQGQGGPCVLVGAAVPAAEGGPVPTCP